MSTSSTDLSQFRHGVQEIYTLHPADTRLFSSIPATGTEVVLKATDDGVLLLAWPGLEFPESVMCSKPGDHERLTLNMDRGHPLLAIVIDVSPLSQAVTMVIGITFLQSLIGGMKLSLGVDEKIVEQLAQRLGVDAMTSDKACEYLIRDFNFIAPQDLPSGMEYPTQDRWVAIPSRGRQENRFSRFRLLGLQHSIEIHRHEDHGQGSYRVEKLIWSPKPVHGAGGDPLLLFNGNLAFVDASVVAALADSSSDLDEIVASSDSYLELWNQFQDLEISDLREKMVATGALAYNSRRYDETRQCWAFQNSNPDKEMLGELDILWADADVEASSSPPDLANWVPYRDMSEDSDVGVARVIAASYYGKYDRVDRSRSEVLVSMAEGSFQGRREAPPEKGWLFLRWRGNQTQIKRRKQAMERILNPVFGIPTLKYLLESLPAPHRRLSSTPALSPRARNCFRGGNPTERQVEALRIALNTPDIAIIQGPPGTGKTRTIAALVQRLNETARENSMPAKRFLLTSFQHDAVDTVANATSLMDLPAIRFGQKSSQSDQSSARTPVDRWVEDLASAIEANLANYGERPVSSILNQVSAVSMTYAKSPGTNETTIRALREVADLIQAKVPTDLILRLRDLIRKLQDKRLPEEHAESSLRRALSGLRHTLESFSDDGPRSAFKLLRCVDHAWLLPNEVDTLRKAEAWDGDDNEAPEFLPELAELREKLLGKLSNVEKIEKRVLLANADVCSLLEDIQTVLRDSIRKSPDEGPAATLELFLDELRENPEAGKNSVESYSALLAATCQGAGSGRVMSILADDGCSFDTVIVDEAARANPLDLMIPMSLARRRIILVGDHRQLPHLLEPKVEKALASSMKKETEIAIRQSLFERLFNHVRELEGIDGVRRCVTLDRQYRMHPVLAEVVSKIFYEPHNEAFTSPGDLDFQKSFEHGLDGKKEGKLVMWHSVTHQDGREEKHRGGFSWFRRAEAQVTAKIAYHLLQEKPELSIGVITSYAAQVDVIMQELYHLGVVTRTSDSDQPEISPNYCQFPPGITNQFGDFERLRVGTVDAFQGKEFDVVILSPVRSNTIKLEVNGSNHEIGMRGKFGHLLLANRMCVAMSRQRRLLIVVGDDQMFTDRSNHEGQAAGDDSETNAVPGLTEVLRMCEGPYGLRVGNSDWMTR